MLQHGAPQPGIAAQAAQRLAFDLPRPLAGDPQPLASEEEIGLSRQMLEGGRVERERPRDRLIEANLRLVVSIARR